MKIHRINFESATKKTFKKTGESMCIKEENSDQNCNKGIKKKEIRCFK